jgi:hypothetical protein
MDIKTCSKCKQSKSIDRFHENKRYKDSHYCWCRECCRAYGVKWDRQHPNSRKNSSLKIDFGITLNDYQSMFNRQNGQCAICGKYQSELKKALHVDHDHKTDKIRGLLCYNCNRGIGHLQDNITILNNAISYLVKEE